MLNHIEFKDSTYQVGFLSSDLNKNDKSCPRHFHSCSNHAVFGSVLGIRAKWTIIAEVCSKSVNGGGQDV